MPKKSRFTPQQQRVYRRRRIVALIAALVALALVVFIVISDVRFAGAVVSAVNGKLHPDDVQHITRSAVPAPDPTLAQARTAGIPDCTSNDVALALDPPATGSSSSASSSSSSASSSASGSSGASGSANSSAKASGSASDDPDTENSSASASGTDSSTSDSTVDYSGSVSFGGTIAFTAVLTHTSKQNCLVNAAPDSESLTVTSEATGAVVYDSSVCDEDPVYLLMRDTDEDRRTVSWGAYAQTTQCVANPTADDAVPAGYYLVQLQLSGVDGAKSKQTEVYVTASASSSSKSSSSASSDDASSSSDADSGSAADSSSSDSSDSGSSQSE